MRILINYADRGFFQAQKQNEISGLEYGFDRVIKYNRSSLDSDFQQKNEHILRESRGAGYWLWKPYIIVKALKEVSPDDQIFYCDSGSRFISNVAPLFELCNKEEIVLFGSMHLNRTWTKMDAFYYMGSKSYDCKSAIASFIICKNTMRSKEFFKELLEYSQDRRIITDDPNTCGQDNFIEFRDHRHDQAILSIMANDRGMTLHRDPSQYGNGLLDKYPQDTYGQIIDHTRRRD